MRFLFLESRRGKRCELEYSSCVARGMAKKLRDAGHEVKEVESPSPADANEAIRNFGPDHVWWVGHGNNCATTLENVDLWISSDKCGCQEKNTDILSGFSANALSCITAKCLGKDLTKNHGTSWYLGYYESFVFVWCKCPETWGCACGQYNPAPDKVRDHVLRKSMICMHESNLFFTVGLAKGYSPPQAHGLSLKAFKKWIKFWEEFEPQSDTEEGLANLVNSCLRRDKKRQRLVRNGEYVKPVEPKKPPEQPQREKKFPVHAVVGALGAAIASVGLVKAE